MVSHTFKGELVGIACKIGAYDTSWFGKDSALGRTYKDSMIGT